MRKLTLFCLCLGLTYVTAPTQAQSASGPSAWVYVSIQISDTTSDVFGAVADADGKLSLISAAPLATNLNSLVVNGSYLIGSPMQGTSIDSYHIDLDGKLTFAKSTDAATNGGCSQTIPGPLVLDHTGQDLYDFYFIGQDCLNNDYQAWKVTKSTGALTFLDATDGNILIPGGALISFTGNNKYAYTSSCVDFIESIIGYKRSSDGSLTDLSSPTPFPAVPKHGDIFCPFAAAADPANHLAIPMQLIDTGNNFTPLGPYQLAAYTVNGDGSLSTSSTFSNMPNVAVGTITTISMSPSGKLLAVGGTNGLQIFHFNGADPITPYTADLTPLQVDQMFWDNNNHLYVIGTAANELAVLTVTPTSISLAGIYSVPKPIGLVVQPLPLP